MTPTNDIPRIAEEGTNVQGLRYTLTAAQMKRRERGQTIYQHDRKVEEYEVSKGEWV